ncbi:putative E3 ubiquitin ligase RBR family [Helianthus anomalus]
MKSHKLKSTGEAKLKSLATKKGWNECIKCKNSVELAFGCYHIYCRCGYEFFYTCGVERVNKKPACRCPLWKERNILYA